MGCLAAARMSPWRPNGANGMLGLRPVPRRVAMKRRDFITLIGGAMTWPLAARAQQPGKLPTIGFLGASTPSAWSRWSAAFVQRLRELGWIEGRTVAIEYRWADGRNERFPRSRPNSFSLRSMSSSQWGVQLWPQSRRHRPFRSCSQLQSILLGPVWLRR